MTTLQDQPIAVEREPTHSPAELTESVSIPSPEFSRGESMLKRVLFLVLALAITWGYGVFIFSFSAPAPGRAGIDENAYLVGGRLLAQRGTTGFKPSDDYQFVGAMWLRTPGGWYYPKYPFGTSLLDAVMVRLHHNEWAFLVSPLCATLAVLGMFFLARPIVGSFYAILAMLVLAMGPTTLQLAITPNSHAPALCCVVWGMVFLLQWWKTGRWWIGAIAGLLLGYAVTIRYTEALLLFPLYPLEVVRSDNYIGPKLLPFLKMLGFLPVGPIGIAALSRVRWKRWRSYISAAVPVIAWSIPVGALLLFNYFTVGHFSGYDVTNESSGFSIEYLVQKWDYAINQINLLGVFVFTSLGVAGLALMYRGNRRRALIFTVWFLPGVMLYMAYYWGLNVPGIWYLRFFLTLFPPLIVAGMYLLREVDRLPIDGSPPCLHGGLNGGILEQSSVGHSARREHTAGNMVHKRSILTPIVAGILTACAASVGLWGSLDELTRQHRGNMNLHYSAREVISHIKPSSGGRPMILADKGMFPQLLMYLQFMYDADWYANDIFAIRAGGGFGLAGALNGDKSNDNAPRELQRERIEHIDAFRKSKSDADFIRDAHVLMNQALDHGRRIYLVIEPIEADYFRHRFITKDVEMTQVNRWNEPCKVTFPDWSKQSPLAPSVIPDTIILPWHPRAWAMYEITRVSSGQPATRN